MLLHQIYQFRTLMMEKRSGKTCLYVTPMFTSEVNGFVMIVCVNIVRHCAFFHLFRTNYTEIPCVCTKGLRRACEGTCSETRQRCLKRNWWDQDSNYLHVVHQFINSSKLELGISIQFYEGSLSILCKRKSHFRFTTRLKSFGN